MQNKDSSTLVAALAGAAIGAGVALLVAPQSGEETRRRLRDSANSVKHGMSDSAHITKDAARNVADTVAEASGEAMQTVKDAGKNVQKTNSQTAEEI